MVECDIIHVAIDIKQSYNKEIYIWKGKCITN